MVWLIHAMADVYNAKRTSYKQYK